MLKAILATILALAVAVPVVGVFVSSPKCDVKWDLETDFEMVKHVREDLANCKELRVELLSPGGPVVTSLEIANLMREAKAKGQTIEIHGRSMVASGATFVLVSGTKGLRYIQHNTVFLVHGIQQGSPFGEVSCLLYPYEPENENDQVVKALYDAMIYIYMSEAGVDRPTAMGWITCGSSVVGNGTLAVELGFADQEEGI